MALSENQKKFAYEFVMNGKNRSEAYRASYPGADKLTPKQVSDRADKVMHSKNVLDEIERLKVSNAKAEIITREDLLKGLKDLHDVSKENSYITGESDDGKVIRVLVPKAADIYVKVVDRIAKMIGADAPAMVENNINVHIDKELVKYGS